MNKLKKFEGVMTAVRLERKYPGSCYINGFIHKIEANLLIIQQFHDFFCEGYVIIKLSDIIRFRSNEYERFFENILQKEGLLNKVGYNYSLPLNSIESVLHYFIKEQQIIIVECESIESDDDDKFYIGKAVDIEDSIIWFIEINALGKWEKTEIGIKIRNITQIQFDTPYIQIFSKYTAPGGGHK